MKFLAKFFLRWIATSVGLWLAVRLLGSGGGTYDPSAEVFAVAGLILSLINAFVKPVVSLIALPITFITLGLFSLVINGLMVYISLGFVDGIEMPFINAVLAGIIIGIVNFIINQALDAAKTSE